MVALQFSPGDQVEIRLAHTEIKGIIMQSSASDIYLVKLSSGYVIGVPKESILGGSVTGKVSAEKENVSVRVSKDLPAIGMVITGGTIASRVDPKTGAAAPFTNVDEFVRFYPELQKTVRLKQIEIPFLLLSENMYSEHWIIIAERVHALLEDPEIQGVIVSHGTDTLHYTAAALSFFLKNVNKPVVLTYSQRSSDRPSSDAHFNLECAARMALSNVAEIMLVGHGSVNDDFCSVIRGTEARKMHSSRRDTFQSLNGLPIARVWPDRIEFLSAYRARHSGRCELDSAYTDKVGLVFYYPGQDPSILDYYALKYKGIVIAGTGFGHVMTEGPGSWIPRLKKHIGAGLVVCMTSQCFSGQSDGHIYSAGRALLDAGVIYLDDMLPEVAFVKLGWVLGHYGWKGQAKEKMLENISGEIRERLTYRGSVVSK